MPDFGSRPATLEQPDMISSAQRRHFVSPGLVFWCAFVVCCWYLWPCVFRGWYSHDEGLLAHCADRVLQGELPHRDFDDTYTGGLSFLHAAAFHFLGRSLASIRIIFLVAVLCWIPVCYSLARQFSGAGAAALVTVCCLTWGPPNYFASLPSWYNLFCAMGGTLCLIRYSEKRERFWLLLAGLLGGCSITIKIIGLYFLAAGCFTIWWIEQINEERESVATKTRLWRSSVVAWGLAAALTGLLVLVIRRRLGFAELAQFVVPATIMAIQPGIAELRGFGNLGLQRLTRTMVSLVWFGTGACLPVILFLTPYALSQSLPDLWQGVFVLPQLRLEHASRGLPDSRTLLWGLPLLLFVSFEGFRPRRLVPHSLGGVFIASGVGAITFFSTFDPQCYLQIWFAISNSLPWVIIWAAIRQQQTLRSCPRYVLPLFAIAMATAIQSLVQFPFAGHVYFLYVAPMVILTAFAAAAGPEGKLELPMSVMLILAVALITLRFTTVPLNFGFRTNDPKDPYLYWAHPKVKLWLKEYDVRQFALLQDMLQRNTASEEMIFATPDCPEIYFFADRRNATRTMFDFFESTDGRVSRLVKMLEEKKISIVVINRFPLFSPEVEPEFIQYLQRRYTHRRSIGRFYVYSSKKLL